MTEVSGWKLWYKRIRERSTLACVSPMQFEGNRLAEQR